MLSFHGYAGPRNAGPQAATNDPGSSWFPTFARAPKRLGRINLLRRSVSSVLDFESDQKLMLRRVAPSLLASFADMFAQDQLYHRPMLQCIGCGTPFVWSAYQAKYCSETCRLREQKRRLRAQMKQARALRAEGRSLRQIAEAVTQPLAIVKGGGEARKQSPNETRATRTLTRDKRDRRRVSHLDGGLMDTLRMG
jgi:predicted nucleic acid-binding Zn ribbon protein